MSRQSGISIITLLLLVVSFAAGVAYLLVGAGPNVQGQLNAQKTAQLVAQAQLIVHRITKCATDYPEADNGSTVHKAYPLGADALVSTLTCPITGNPNLWSGVDGVYPPVPIEGFGDWKYTKATIVGAATSISISITASQPTVYAAALTQAASKMGTPKPARVAASTLTVDIIQ